MARRRRGATTQDRGPVSRTPRRRSTRRSAATAPLAPCRELLASGTVRARQQRRRARRRPSTATAHPAEPLPAADRPLDLAGAPGRDASSRWPRRTPTAIGRAARQRQLVAGVADRRGGRAPRAAPHRRAAVVEARTRSRAARGSRRRARLSLGAPSTTETSSTPRAAPSRRARSRRPACGRSSPRSLRRAQQQRVAGGDRGAADRRLSAAWRSSVSASRAKVAFSSSRRLSAARSRGAGVVAGRVEADRVGVVGVGEPERGGGAGSSRATKRGLAARDRDGQRLGGVVAALQDQRVEQVADADRASRRARRAATRPGSRRRAPSAPARRRRQVARARGRRSSASSRWRSAAAAPAPCAARVSPCAASIRAQAAASSSAAAPSRPGAPAAGRREQQRAPERQQPRPAAGCASRDLRAPQRSFSLSPGAQHLRVDVGVQLAAARRRRHPVCSAIATAGCRRA